MALPGALRTRFRLETKARVLSLALLGVGFGLGGVLFGESVWGGTSEVHVALEVGTLLVLVGLYLSVRNVFREEATHRSSLKAIVLSALDAIFTVDADGTILSFNPAGEKMFGYAAAEVVGQKLGFLLPEFRPGEGEDAKSVRCYVETSATKEIGISHEVKGRRQNGKIFPIGLTINEMRSDGRSRFVGIARDITERKRMETQFRESDRQLRGILDYAPLSISLKDLAGRYRLVNRHYQEIFNVCPEDVIGKTTHDVFPEMGDAEEAEDRKALAALEALEGQEVTVKIKGVPRTFLQTKFILRDVAGWPSEICSIASEITERKQMETALALRSGELERLTEIVRQSEQRLQVVLDTAAAGIITIDEQGTIESFNPVAEQIFGYAAEKIIGQNVRMLMPSPDRERHDGYLKRYLETGERKIIGKGREVEGRRKNGSTFPMHLGISEAILDDRNQRVFTGIVTDITKRKQAEEALHAAKEEAEAATRTKSEFLATMSHEIRTPMNGVIGMAGLLLGTELDSEQRQYAETVRQSADCLLTVINDILDFSKLEAGRFELEIVDFDLVEVVENVAELLGPQATAKGIDFVTYFAPDVPLIVRGDPSRLRQILMNLAGNAVKFTEKGSVALDIGVIEQTKTGFQMRFEVIDSGIGIPREAQKHLFEKFTQADSSTTRRYGGTGLGLAICQQLIKLMGGGIGLKSVPGKGSTFWFEIPLGQQQDGDKPEIVPLEDLSNLRTLVVDDSELNRRIFRKQFESWGMTVTCVEGAGEALATLAKARKQNAPYDVAVLDHMMPGMNGEELGMRIRKKPEFAEMKLVLATSMGMQEDAAHFRAIGFDAYLTKPVRQSLLFDTIANLCGETVPDAQNIIAKEKEEASRKKKAASRRRLRILLAEDNRINQLLASVMLQKKGHRVDAVGNGIEAVKAVQTIPYDLVLMDVQMPEMGGLEATEKIRSLPGEVGRIPIIALTANAMKGDRESYLAAGMDDYISKPIDAQKMFDALQRWGDKTQPSETAPDAKPAKEKKRRQALSPKES